MSKQGITLTRKAEGFRNYPVIVAQTEIGELWILVYSGEEICIQPADATNEYGGISSNVTINNVAYTFTFRAYAEPQSAGASRPWQIDGYKSYARRNDDCTKGFSSAARNKAYTAAQAALDKMIKEMPSIFQEGANYSAKSRIERNNSEIQKLREKIEALEKDNQEAQEAIQENSVLIHDSHL